MPLAKPGGKALSEWNIALRTALERRREASDAARRLSTALHTPKEEPALGGGLSASNIAEVMRPQSTALREYGLRSDFTFAPLADQRDNCVMQVCAWDDAVPNSTVSGCVNLRSTFNINSDLETTDIATPVTVFALNHKRFETLADAVREQPTLAAALEAVCDIFDSTHTVKFTPLASPQTLHVPVRADDTARGVTQSVRVLHHRYDASRPASGMAVARDLRVDRVEVCFHEDVKSRQFIAESLRVYNKKTKATACFVMSNYAPPGQASAVPRTAAHVFGTGRHLVGASANNLLALHSLSLPPHGQALAQALAAVRSLAHAAALSPAEGLASRAFEVFRADPGLAHAGVSLVHTYPGLRIVTLDIPLDTPHYGQRSRKVCLVLSAVMDCQDMHVAALESAFAGQRSVFPLRSLPPRSLPLRSLPPHAPPHSPATAPPAPQTNPPAKPRVAGRVLAADAPPAAALLLPAPRAEPKVASQAAPKTVLKTVLKAAPKTEPKAVPKVASQAAPKAVLKAAPKTEPKAVLEAAPKPATKVAFQAAPEPKPAPATPLATPVPSMLVLPGRRVGMGFRVLL